MGLTCEVSDSGTKYASRTTLHAADASRFTHDVSLDSLKAQQQAWEAFAACAVSMIPILKKHMEAVTQQTERAAMDLMVHISALASPARLQDPPIQR